MQIRNYHSADRPQTIALWDTVFPNSMGHNSHPESIDRKVATDDRLFFVAVADDKVIGTVMAGYDGHRGWLYSLAVATAYRRTGIGTQLVRHAENALAALGCPKVNLQIMADNSAVVGFYNALGFATEDRISMGKVL